MNLDSAKGTNCASGCQAILALLLACEKYQTTSVVALLTDLQETWFIMWREGDTVFYHLFGSSNDAVGYLEHYLGLDADLMVNPSMDIQLDGLDVLWRGKRQKRLPAIEEHPSAGRLSELEGLLSVGEDNYFVAHRLIHAVRSLPEFWHLSAESLGLEYHGSSSEPPPFMYT